MMKNGRCHDAQTLHLLSGPHLQDSVVFVSSQHLLLPGSLEDLRLLYSPLETRLVHSLPAYCVSFPVVGCPPSSLSTPMCPEVLLHLVSHVGVGPPALQESHHLQVASAAGPVHGCAVQLEGTDRI